MMILCYIGDGDFSFARSLSRMRICRSLTASTMDSQSKLFSSFDSSRSNVQAILSDGHQVIYNVDATRIHETLFLGSQYCNQQDSRNSSTSCSCSSSSSSSSSSNSTNIDVAKTDNDRVDDSSVTVPFPISIHDQQPDPLTAAAAYDLVLWNFPHKVGKQNIKHNR